MTTGLRVQTQAPGSAHADLGFWMHQQIVGQPMAMNERQLVDMIESISANRYVLPRERKTGARITDKGTAIVEIHGTLINRSPVMASFWGLVSYEGLAEQCRRLETHPEVKRVVLDINSPGGMVLGIRAASDALIALGKKKPVHAIAHDMAASAGYWLACCAKTISIVPDGEAGSIGVRAGHISYAEMLERDGVHVTLFQAGATKTDGSPYRLLSAGEAAEEQFAIDRAYDQFVAHVAKQRPAMSDAAVRDTDARMFSGEDAVAAGLADRVETLDELIERLESGKEPARAEATGKDTKSHPVSASGSVAAVARLLRSSSSRPASGQSTGEKAMSVANGAAAGEDGIAGLITQAVRGIAAEDRQRQAVADNTITRAEAERLADERARAAVKADRARVAAILGHESAKGREAMAHKLAFSDAGMSVEAAVDLLDAAPKAEAKSAGGDGLASALAARMGQGGAAAGVKADVSAGGEGRSAKPSLADKIGAKFNARKGA